jgi:hypothetical protein
MELWQQVFYTQAISMGASSLLCKGNKMTILDG